MPLNAALPFLTLPDPAVTGEGALDPLGLATIGDRLAEQILPGLRARMSRPRFLTAIAACAAVCEGFEDQIASDSVTPAYIVFEWLVVDAFMRANDTENTRGTPGTLKARTAKASGEPMSARSYLRVPTIFGFHGVYKPLARNLGIVDEDFRLADNGYLLLQRWQQEQGLLGFLESSVASGEGGSVRQSLRSAVEEGLKLGFSKRSPTWQGWHLLAEHLAPGKIAHNEANFIRSMLLETNGGTRSEIFTLLDNAPLLGQLPESKLLRTVLLPKASKELAVKLEAIGDFESVASLLERAFDWLRYLSSNSGFHALTPTDWTCPPN